MTIFISNSIVHIKNMHLLSQSVNLRQPHLKKKEKKSTLIYYMHEE